MIRAAQHGMQPTHCARRNATRWRAADAHVSVLFGSKPLLSIESWSSVCGLSVSLADRLRALATATNFLKTMHINILLTEACVTYADRAHWDAIVDLSNTPGFEMLYPRVFVSNSTGRDLDKLRYLQNELWSRNLRPILGTDWGYNMYSGNGDLPDHTNDENYSIQVNRGCS